MNRNNRWMVGWMDRKKIDDTKMEDWMDIKSGWLDG